MSLYTLLQISSLDFIFIALFSLIIVILLFSQKIMKIRKFLFLSSTFNKKSTHSNKVKKITRNEKSYIYVNLNTVRDFPYIIESGIDDYIFTGWYRGLDDCIVIQKNYSGTVTLDNVYIKNLTKSHIAQGHALYVEGSQVNKNYSSVRLKLIGNNYFESELKYSSIKLEKGRILFINGEGLLISSCGNLETLQEKISKKKLNDVKIITQNSRIYSLNSKNDVIYKKKKYSHAAILEDISRGIEKEQITS